MTDLSDRIIRYGAFVPCRTAFVDARLPGSENGEHFAIIGKGASENAEQHVHLNEPHGFCVSATGYGPGNGAALHSHATAETFIVLSGVWRFVWGRDGSAGEVVLGQGDIFNVPTGMFRGFSNIGQGFGVLMSITGGDEVGNGAVWAPEVIEKAEKAGLILKEDGTIFEKGPGKRLPKGMKKAAKLDDAALAGFAEPSAMKIVSRYIRRYWDLMALAGSGPCKVLGARGIIRDKPGFDIDFLSGATPPSTASSDFPSVLLPVAGHWRVSWDGGETILAPGDTMSIPAGLAYTPAAAMSGEAALYQVVGTGEPAGETWAG